MTDSRAEHHRPQFRALGRPHRQRVGRSTTAAKRSTPKYGPLDLDGDLPARLRGIGRRDDLHRPSTFDPVIGDVLVGEQRVDFPGGVLVEQAEVTASG